MCICVCVLVFVGVSRRGSYTPGQRDSELPVYDAENGDIRRDNKGSVKLVATVHKDDEGNGADAAALPTPDSNTSSPGRRVHVTEVTRCEW